jgi:hypothetical protein
MKQSMNTDKQIREKLLNAEVQAPDFEALLGNETLDALSLRTALSAKLRNHQAEAPEFDALFSESLLGTLPVNEKDVAPVRNKWPIWLSVASVAAACLTIAFLLPYTLRNKGTESASYALQLTNKASISPKHTSEANNVQTIAKPQVLTNAFQASTPAVMSESTVSVVMDEIASSVQHEIVSDSADNQVTQKIQPEIRTIALASSYNKSLKQAYEKARIQKVKAKKERISIGANLNGSNRLLSIVNNKSHSGSLMSSVVNNTGAGYEGLSGSAGPALRSATIDENEWNDVENLTANQFQNYETNYQLPVNIGLTVSIPIVENLNLITGIQYTFIANHIAGSTFDLRQELHYLGIPAKISLDLVKRKKFTAYMIAGGTIEKGLSGIQKSEVLSQDIWEGKQSIKGFAASLTGGLGVGYDLGTKLLLCLEPGVSWYIPTNQPVCYRTEQPFNFSLNFGLRYRFQ